ncbi:MAG: hypothetical protein ACI9TH_001356 [Kiritimatiellia bacterium]
MEWTPTADSSFMDPALISQQLNFGDVEISTASAFNGNNGGSIFVSGDILFDNGANGHTLTLLADNQISFDDAVIAPISVDSLNVMMVANEGISFSSSRLNLGLQGSLLMNADANNDGGALSFISSSVEAAFDVIGSGSDISTTLGSPIRANNDIFLVATDDILLGDNLQSQNTVVVRADNDLILDNQDPTLVPRLFLGLNGTALCADGDQNGGGNLTSNGNGPHTVFSTSGSVFVHGFNVDLTDVNLLTTSAGGGSVSVVAENDLTFANVNQPPGTTHFGVNFAAVAGGNINLGTRIQADNAIGLQAANELRIPVNPPDPLLQAADIGLSAANMVNLGTPAQVSASSSIVVGNGITGTEFTDLNGTLAENGFVDSGDLSSQLPANAAGKPTARVMIDNRIPPPDNKPNNTPDPIPDPVIPPTVIPDITIPTIVRRTPDPIPDPVIPPTVIPDITTREGQDIDRSRVSLVVESPNFKITAVQFSEFYFLHEKMQISEYASELDFYFIDYLVFGEANVAADSRLPARAKKTLYFGGPKPYQL